MKNRIVKILAFSCLLCIVICSVYKVLSWKDTSGDYISVIEQMNNTNDNLIDVVFVGSSHVYRGIYPSVIWKEKGYSAFDLSVSEQNKYNAYYNLIELLKKQSPKIVFVEAYGLMFDKNEMPGNLYRNLLAVNPGINSVKMINETITDNEEDRMMFLTGWPLMHTRYRELQKYDFIPNPANEYLRGAVIMNGVESASIDEEMIKNKEKTQISDSNRLWIDRLSELAKKENFELVFFMTPYEESHAERKIENGAVEYIESLGYTYIDLKDHMNEMDFVPERDMGDVWHCNLEGARKVSSYLANYIDDNYAVEDHRGNKDYYQWDLDLKHYEHVLLERRINLAASTEELIELVDSNPDLTIVLSLDGEYYYALPYMEMFGINPEDCANGGKWIISGGSASKIMDNTPGETHYFELNTYETITIRYRGTADCTGDVLIGKDEVNQYSDGLNIIIYDNFEEKYLGTYTVF